MQVTNEVAIEEYNGLKLGVLEAIKSEKVIVLASMNKIQLPTNINDMIALQLRGWLFQYYNEIEDYDSYNEVNEKVINYQQY